MLSWLGGNTASTISNADVRTLKRALDQHAVPVLVDVRSPGEYQRAHVPGALNIPLDSLASRLDELQDYKDGQVWLICQSGGRSMVAARSLQSVGFQPINVAGGTGAWIGQGWPVE
jgi:rhodanese-related sulfurtransferase